MTQHDEWVFIGVVARPFGVAGAVKLNLSNPHSKTLKEGLKLRLVNARGESSEVTLGKVRPDARVDVEGWISRDQALLWSAAKVFVRRMDLPPLNEDELYLADLLGATVQDINGITLGTIIGFSENKAQHRAIIEDDKGKVVLVPFLVPIVVEIDLEEAIVVLDPPEGLFE